MSTVRDHCTTWRGRQTNQRRQRARKTPKKSPKSKQPSTTTDSLRALSTSRTRGWARTAKTSTLLPQTQCSDEVNENVSCCNAIFLFLCRRARQGYRSRQGMGPLRMRWDASCPIRNKHKTDNEKPTPTKKHQPWQRAWKYVQGSISR